MGNVTEMEKARGHGGMCCSLSSKASVRLPKHLAVCLPYITPGKMNNLRNGTTPMSDSRGNIWETGWQGNKFSEASLQCS
ncbi:uncharacterized [Tachysurus ichikawai]